MHWVEYVGSTGLGESTEALALECGCFHFINETSKASLGAVAVNLHTKSLSMASQADN